MSIAKPATPTTPTTAFTYTNMSSPQTTSTSSTTATTATTEVGTITTITTTVTIKRARDGATTTSTECKNVTVPWVTEARVLGSTPVQTIDPGASPEKDEKHPIWLGTGQIPVVSLTDSQKKYRFYLRNYLSGQKYGRKGDQIICILEVDPDKALSVQAISSGIGEVGIQASNGVFSDLYWYNIHGTLYYTGVSTPIALGMKDGDTLHGN